MPSILRHIGMRMASIPFVEKAVRDQADLSAFKGRPSARLVVGVSLIGISMIMGWPSVGGFGVLALYLRDPLVFIIGGPATYALSWVVWGLGMLIAGPDNLFYAKEIARWMARRVVLKLAPDNFAGEMGPAPEKPPLGG